LRQQQNRCMISTNKMSTLNRQEQDCAQIMIRGAIDSVSPSEISGWLYGGNANLRGRRVLAFFEENCIGAGEVREFRQDLADAGLGDGFHGFRFDITAPDSNRLGSIVVRLEGDDATILQKDSRVIGRFDPPEISSRVGSIFDRGPILQWMRTRSWLDQSQYDYLWYLDQLGAYNRMLSAAEQTHVGEVRESASVASELLELFHMAEIVIETQEARTPADLSGVLRKVVSIGALEPIVAAWSVSPGRLRIIEGSHRDTSRWASDALRTNYAIGPNRLVFFNARCRVEVNLGAEPLHMFFANSLRG
jgi:hypothetical protein